mgnify:CR=1 FL=1
MSLKEAAVEISKFQKFDLLLTIFALLILAHDKFNLNLISSNFSSLVLVGILFLFLINIILRSVYKLTDLGLRNIERISEFYRSLLVGVTGGIMVSISGSTEFETLSLSNLLGITIELVILSLIILGSAYLYIIIPEEVEE